MLTKRVVQENSPKIVLVVDDEPAVLKFVAAALRHDGFQVIAIRSPQEAWLAAAAAEVSKISVFIGDLLAYQPGMAELVSSLRVSNPDLQMLCITCFGEWEARRAGVLPEIPILHKPFTAAALREAVRGTSSREHQPASRYRAA